MSTYMFASMNWTTGTGTADNASLTTLQYMALQGGTSTQVNALDEVYIGGQAGSSSPVLFLLGRDSTVVGTPTALSTPNSNGPTGASAGVLTNAAVGAITGGTQAIRSNSVSLGKMTFTINTYAGAMRCNYANTQDRFQILGNTASLGEMSLSAFTGSTSSSVSSHFIYETA